MGRWLASQSAGGPVPVSSLLRSPLRTVPRLSRLSSTWLTNTVLTQSTLSKLKLFPKLSPRRSCFPFFSWEFPNQAGIGCNLISPSDAENFLGFLQELRAQPAAKNLLLSAAVSVTPFHGSDGTSMTNVSDFAAVLDHIAVMNYDINVGVHATFLTNVFI